MHKILIVEDDLVIAHAIKNHMEMWGCQAQCAENFQDIMTEFNEFAPDLVLLDIGLPFFNGYYWCTQIRTVSKIPIIFISSASDNMNIVMAMNMGGDDFIAKPFDLTVLTAKVQAMLRRTYDFAAGDSSIEHHGAVLNLGDASLNYQGEKIDLTKNEFKILQILLENKGRVVSRDDIMVRLWETDCFVDENTLTVNVARLRKKLDSYGLGDFIRTKKEWDIWWNNMFKKFIASKYKSIMLFSIYLVVFCLVAFLYGMPADGLLYAVLLCVFFTVVFMGYSFARYRQKAAILADIRARIEFGPEALPKAANDIEAQYQAMIESLYEKTSQAISMRDQEISEMIDYYTLWAHQVKTPIAAMRLLLQGQEASLERDAMQMELFKIEQYVEMVLQYLRLGSDSTDFVIKEQSVDPMIKDAVKKYSTMFIKKKISLNYEETGLRVISDEKWLTFVVEQVLSNALKYTPPGGKISIYAERGENEAAGGALIIEDTGIGIQKEDIPRVFDRGYTGYNGRRDKKSTGIGLYLCRQIMGKLGHSLTIESEVGCGTKVKMGLAYKSVRFE